MDFGIGGKIAIVTGGGTGIGHAIAKSFHDEGATVVINGRSRERIEAAAKAIGPRAHGVVADLMTAEGAAALADAAERLGPVSFLVNNIGVFDVNDFFEVSDERWLEYFQHNIMTAVRITRIVMKDMLKRDEGSVVFISSEAAIRSIGNMVPYSVTKTAILGLGRSWPRPRNRRSARKCERPSRPSTACSRIPAAKDLSGNILKTEGATTEVVAKDLGIDRTTAFRRLRVVERKGLVVNLEPRPNPRPSYWRTVPGSKLDEALGDFLPSTATLQDEFDDYLRRGGKERK